MLERLNSFLKFEDAEGFFSLRMRGIKLWDVLRYSVIDTLMRDGDGLPASFSRRSVYRSVLSFLTDAALLADSLCRSGNTKYDIVFVNTSDRRIVMQGKKINAYNYPLINRLAGDKKILLIDMMGGDVTAEYPCDTIQSAAVMTASRIYARMLRFNDTEKRILSDIGRKIRENFAINLNMISTAAQSMAGAAVLKTFFKYLFRRCRPTAVVFSDNGNMKGLIEAARETDVVSIDLQHSMISRLNALYRYFGARGSSGADISYADYIFTWGEYWHECISAPSEKVPVGFPYAEETLRDIRKINPPRDPRKILFISEGYYSRKAVVAIVTELSMLMPNYMIEYKLRREEYRQWRAVYPEFINRRNITVIDNDEKSIYELLAGAAYHAGINSTAIYEGLMLGPEATFVIRAGWHEEMRELYDNGEAFLVSSAIEIAGLIRSGAKPRGRVSPGNIMKPQSLETAVKKLDDIVNKKKVGND